ncbi:precorrin-6x reductase [Anaerosporobacter mobilis DSM 15930]|jgi:precorrin-6Y C5,15-methyltransferase (decarboxylating)|uniref:Precorrin-6x reductase n=1 Tax=Anaerosporobacter mobilis DSM 15930 TaxID=1120996 RepID=A0A1M7G3Z1_9FIRM|nr:precorrin-6A reductase [Anaerosporobacter mobilis]SHM11094.1 precorrin-6x reductase [Anaerosporobacter mobilis DSM 15930]
MKHILLFAGTTEGRILAEYLNTLKIATHACVATEYGEQLLLNLEYVETTSTRLTADDMISLINQEAFSAVIDATHPYATIVSANIQSACQATNTIYYRVIRESSELLVRSSHTVFVESVEDAVTYLKETSGNIFVTTGSKELYSYTQLPDFKTRIYARTLSSPSVVKECYELGIQGKHLIGMQGPFSVELNYAMLLHTHAKYLVTKESGLPGGFAEKIEAAKQAGVTCIIIGRPQDVKGYTIDEMKKIIPTL